MCNSENALKSYDCILNGTINIGFSNYCISTKKMTNIIVIKCCIDLGVREKTFSNTPLILASVIYFLHTPVLKLGFVIEHC